MSQASINKARAELITTFMKELICDGINLTLGFTKGVLSFCESLVKFGFIIDAGRKTFSTAIFDVYRGLFTGKWDFKNTKGLWTKSVSAIGVNYTDKLFDSFYSSSIGKKLNDNSSNFAKADGFLYSVSEGVGYYTGTLLFASITGGSSTLIQAGAMTAATIGKETTKQFAKIQENAENENREISGSEILKALAVSGTKGVIEGAVMAASGSTKSIIKDSKALQKFASVGIKALKPIVSEGASSIIEGKNVNWEKVGVDTAATIIAEVTGIGVKSLSGQVLKIKSIDVAVSAENTPNGEFGAENETNAITFVYEQLKNVTGKVKDKFIKDTVKKATKEILASG